MLLRQVQIKMSFQRFNYHLRNTFTTIFGKGFDLLPLAFRDKRTYNIIVFASKIILILVCVKRH